MTQDARTYWLALSKSDVPVGDEGEWLTGRELGTLQQLRFLKRRADWRIGRWTAKRAVSLFLGWERRRADYSRIEIVPADDGAPEVLVDGETVPFAISISHSGSVGFCVVSPGTSAVGCDVETIAKRSDRFVSDYFTGAEKEYVGNAARGDRALVETLIWSAKESALKAMRTGLDRDTRSVDVEINRDDLRSGWRGLRVESHESATTFSGWWREDGGMVYTVLTDHATNPPVLIIRD
jgi:4'-phosphopantetheinyl transferase